MQSDVGGTHHDERTDDVQGARGASRGDGGGEPRMQFEGDDPRRRDRDARDEGERAARPVRDDGPDARREREGGLPPLDRDPAEGDRGGEGEREAADGRGERVQLDVRASARVVVLGLWPPSDAPRFEGPLLGRAGRALGALFSVTYPAPFEDAVGRGNLYAEPPDAQLTSERRSPAAAALALFPRLLEAGCRVIALGTVVAHALDLEEWMEWRQVRPAGARLRSFGLDALRPGPGGISAASLPYPTDRSGWWADPGNAARARAFCRTALKEG